MYCRYVDDILMLVASGADERFGYDNLKLVRYTLICFTLIICKDVAKLLKTVTYSWFGFPTKTVTSFFFSKIKDPDDHF